MNTSTNDSPSKKLSQNQAGDFNVKIRKRQIMMRTGVVKVISHPALFITGSAGAVRLRLTRFLRLAENTFEN